MPELDEFVEFFVAGFVIAVAKEFISTIHRAGLFVFNIPDTMAAICMVDLKSDQVFSWPGSQV